MTFTLAADIAYIVAADVIPNDDHIYVMALPQGTPLALDGSGALLFLAVADGLDPWETAAAAAGERTPEIDASVSAFLDHLVSLSILSSTPPIESGHRGP